MILDNFAVRIALLVEIATVKLLLMMPDSVISLLPYSRGTLEKQLIGDYFLINKGQQIPEEASKHYIRQGKLIILLWGTLVSLKIVDIITTIVKA